MIFYKTSLVQFLGEIGLFHKSIVKMCLKIGLDTKINK